MTSLDYSCPEITGEPEARHDQMRGRLRAFADKSAFERMRRLGIERGSYDDRAVQPACGSLRSLRETLWTIHQEQAEAAHGAG